MLKKNNPKQLEKKSDTKHKIVQPLLLSLMVALGMLVGYQLQKDNKAPLLRVFPGEKDIRIGQVEEVMRFIESKYLYEPDAKELTDEMLRDLFEKMDPYSIYIPARNLEHVQDNMNGFFRGIGIESIIMQDTILVSGVIPGSPADEAGLQKMDRIISVDSTNYAGENIDFYRFRQHVQGSKDPVTLHILRKKEGRELDIQILAAHVNTNSVQHYLSLSDSVFYIRIDQFVSDTYREFMQALEIGQKDGRVASLILDLRDNPGGYLNEVTKILSQFFDESEKLLVRTKVRNGKEKDYLTTGRTFYQLGEIIVLINGNSASGSEVLAGALQDWDKGKVIGQPSYGKGLVQEQYNLQSGAAVRLTVANYYLPSGRSIQHDFNLDTSYFDKDYTNGQLDTSFFSLIEKRPLTASQGIQPDILVEDTLFETVIWPRMFRDSWLDQKVIAYIEEEILPAGIDSSTHFNDWPLSESFVEASSWWKNSDEAGRKISEADHQMLLRAKIIQFLQSDLEAVKYLLSRDPYILAALAETKK